MWIKWNLWYDFFNKLVIWWRVWLMVDFEIKKGDNLFLIRVWIVEINLFILFLYIVILLIWFNKILEIFIKDDFNLLILVNFVVKSEIVKVLFLILFFKLFIRELVNFMKEDKWSLCCINKFVIWLVCFVNILMWDVSMFISFIVVVLKKFFDNEFINGNSVFVCFLCGILLRFIFGSNIWIDFMVLLKWVVVCICRLWIKWFKLFKVEYFCLFFVYFLIFGMVNFFGRGILNVCI